MMLRDEIIIIIANFIGSNSQFNENLTLITTVHSSKKFIQYLTYC